MTGRGAAFRAVAAMLLLTACGGARREPIVLEAEQLTGISKEPNYGVVASTTWAAYDEEAYSQKRAALTRAGDVRITSTVSELSEHENWRAEVTVLNYAGGAQNVFEMTLGGVTKKITFGDPALPHGVLRIDDLYFSGVSGNELAIRSVSVGQTFLIVDRIRLFPHEGKVRKMITAWERPLPRIQGKLCHNCVEAESLTPVDHDPNYGATASVGWASYAEASYYGGRAALTRLPGAVMKGRIPNFRPARAYRVALAVNSSSAAENAIDLQLGADTAQRITFGGAKGVILLENIIFENVSHDLLAISAAVVGQPFVIVDAISLEPLDAIPQQATEQSWRAASIDPFEIVCIVCIEAERMEGVAADSNYPVTSGQGWGWYDQEVYSGKRAALTRLPGAVMRSAIPDFRPGPYTVTLTVLNYDPKQKNTFELTLGGETQRVTFGPGSPQGVTRIRNVAFRNVTSAVLSVKAVTIEQPFLVIDVLSLRPGG